MKDNWNSAKAHLTYLACLTLLVTCQVSSASLLDNLNPKDQDRVKAGELVTIRQKNPDDKNSPWPLVTIYQRVDADAEEAAALFFNFELQPQYQPQVIAAKILPPADEADAKNKKMVLVTYTISVPMLGEENYTVKNILSTQETALGSSQKTYKIAWNKLKADSLQEIKGNVQFEPFAAGGALMAYSNLVIPGPKVPSWEMIIKRGISSIEGAASRIVKKARDEKVNQPEVLQEQLNALRAALQEP